MKIITTPMCENLLKMAGLTSYKVVKPDAIEDADIAILLSETESEVPKISVKLNTYSQVYDSIMKIHEKFDTQINCDDLEEIKRLIQENSDKRTYRRMINVKVYSNFLKETIEDMGFNICSEDYDYVVCPDYLEDNVPEKDALIIVPSHGNVSAGIMERINERYGLLERELCMKQ
ncbi:MAG: hypothetical protein BZ138_01885 [Methanosphaera sp. rholeuAM270]|nr:MAG: hypothetical protein BZ138_01885 [Methanosphaera sp. rholeuAM270]